MVASQKPHQKAKKSSSSSSQKQEPTTASSLLPFPLEGEESEFVPIYATADDIRKQITTHLPSTTKAAFARELSSLLPTSKVSVRNLDALLKMKGPRAGAHNIAFYAAYVFFEKIRLRDGKKKSAKREKMEELWAGGNRKLGTDEIQPPGFPREGSHNMHVICKKGQRPVLDQYGKGSIKGTPSMSGGIGMKKLNKK